MRNRRNNKDIQTCITVTADECGGNAEKMVRRFSKKVKKDGIIEEARKRSHFIKPTTVRNEKRRAKKRVIEKAIRKEKELLKTRSNFQRRRS